MVLSAMASVRTRLDQSHHREQHQNIMYGYKTWNMFWALGGLAAHRVYSFILCMYLYIYVYILTL